LKNETPCPLCGGSAKKKVFPYLTAWEGKNYSYIGCPNCGTAYLSPLPGEEDLKKIYTKDAYHDVFYPEIDNRYEKSVHLLGKYCSGKKNLLDFGCGTGGFLKATNNTGLMCYGVELDEETRRKARENSGSEIFSFDELKKKQLKFDIIHLGDVLEHLKDPSGTVNTLKKFLNPGGVFFFEGPLQNNPSLVYLSALALKNLKRFLKMDTPGASPPTHLFLTNKKATMNFFSKTLGFEIKYLRVCETGWPYLSRKPKKSTPGWYLKAILGRLAVFLSLLEPGNNKKLGNRFMAICAE